MPSTLRVALPGGAKSSAAMSRNRRPLVIQEIRPEWRSSCLTFPGFSRCALGRRRGNRPRATGAPRSRCCASASSPRAITGTSLDRSSSVATGPAMSAWTTAESAAGMLLSIQSAGYGGFEISIAATAPISMTNRSRSSLSAVRRCCASVLTGPASGSSRWVSSPPRAECQPTALFPRQPLGAPCVGVDVAAGCRTQFMLLQSLLPLMSAVTQGSPPIGGEL